MDVKLPKLGEGADSGVVVSLHVKEGDQIKEGQTIIELENEKAVAAVPSTASGMVTKIRVKEGDKISVGQVILSIDTSGTEVKPARQDTTAETPKPGRSTPAEVQFVEIKEEVEEVPTKPEAEVAAAPSLRRIARELGIDLRRVRGSERGGRIVMTDLRAYVQRLQMLASQPRAEAGVPAKAKAAPAEAVDFARWGAISRKLVSPLR